MWTLTHAITLFPTLIVFAEIAFLIGYLLKDKNEMVRSIPLQLIAAALVMMELIKQVRSFGADGVYDKYSLPLHFCSLFLYILPLHSFFRTKARPVIDSLAVMLTASLIINMLMMPANIYSAENIKLMFQNYGSFHTVVFHNLVILYGMLTISLKACKFNIKRDVTVSLIFLALYVIIATIFSYTLKTNFHNLYRCNIDFIYNFIEGIKAHMGGFAWIMQAIYVGLLFIATLIMCIVSYFAAYGVDKLVTLITRKKKDEITTTV
jgi:hypothetical protein